MNRILIVASDSDGYRVLRTLRETRFENDVLILSAKSDGSRPVIEFGAIRVEPASRTVYRHGKPVALRPKEIDLLLALIRQQGEVVSRDDLLNEVWHYDADVVTRTVDTHVLELRRKLEDDPGSPRHILTARKAGYRLQF